MKKFGITFILILLFTTLAFNNSFVYKQEKYIDLNNFDEVNVTIFLGMIKARQTDHFISPSKKQQLGLEGSQSLFLYSKHYPLNIFGSEPSKFVYDKDLYSSLHMLSGIYSLRNDDKLQSMDIRQVSELIYLIKNKKYSEFYETVQSNQLARIAQP